MGIYREGRGIPATGRWGSNRPHFRGAFRWILTLFVILAGFQAEAAACGLPENIRFYGKSLSPGEGCRHIKRAFAMAQQKLRLFNLIAGHVGEWPIQELESARLSDMGWLDIFEAEGDGESVLIGGISAHGYFDPTWATPVIGFVRNHPEVLVHEFLHALLWRFRDRIVSLSGPGYRFETPLPWKQIDHHGSLDIFKWARDMAFLQFDCRNPIGVNCEAW